MKKCANICVILLPIGMVFTMSVYVSMAMQMFGSNSLSYSTICRLQQLLRIRYSACMEVYLQVSIHLIRLSSLIVCKRLPTRDQFVIYYGLIQMIDVVGEYHPEEQVTPSERTSQLSLIKQMG